MSFSASLSPCPSIIHSSDSVDGSPGDPQVNVAMDAQNKAALSIHPIHSPMHPSLVLLSQEPDPKEEEEEGVECAQGEREESMETHAEHFCLLAVETLNGDAVRLPGKAGA